METGTASPIHSLDACTPHSGQQSHAVPQPASPVSPVEVVTIAEDAVKMVSNISFLSAMTKRCTTCRPLCMACILQEVRADVPLALLPVVSLLTACSRWEAAFHDTLHNEGAHMLAQRRPKTFV